MDKIRLNIVKELKGGRLVDKNFYGSVVKAFAVF